MSGSGIDLSCRSQGGGDFVMRSSLVHFDFALLIFITGASSRQVTTKAVYHDFVIRTTTILAHCGALLLCWGVSQSIFPDQESSSAALRLSSEHPVRVEHCVEGLIHLDNVTLSKLRRNIRVVELESR